MQIGDKVICLYNDVDMLYDDSSNNSKLELNKVYTVIDKYSDIRDELYFYIFIDVIGEYSYNHRRFITTQELRKRKIDKLCSKKTKK